MSTLCFFISSLSWVRRSVVSTFSISRSILTSVTPHASDHPTCLFSSSQLWSCIEWQFGGSGVGTMCRCKIDPWQKLFQELEDIALVRRLLHEHLLLLDAKWGGWQTASCLLVTGKQQVGVRIRTHLQALVASPAVWNVEEGNGGWAHDNLSKPSLQIEKAEI
jgi:hypothetical protein